MASFFKIFKKSSNPPKISTATSPCNISDAVYIRDEDPVQKIENATGLFDCNAELLKSKYFHVSKKTPFSLQNLCLFTIIESIHKNSAIVRSTPILDSFYFQEISCLKLLEPWYGDYHRLLKLPLPLQFLKILIRIRMLLNDMFLVHDMEVFSMPWLTVSLIYRCQFFLKPYITVYDTNTVIFVYRTNLSANCDLMLDTCQLCQNFLHSNERQTNIARGHYNFVTPCHNCYRHYCSAVKDISQNVNENVIECYKDLSKLCTGKSEFASYKNLCNFKSTYSHDDIFDAITCEDI